MSGEWFDVRTRRRLQLAIYATLILLAVAVVVVLGIATARARLDLDIRLAILNDVLAGAAVLLGLVAGALALHAHAAATGTTSVRAQVWLGSSRRNELVVLADSGPTGRFRSIGVEGQGALHIRLRNESRFDARQLRLLVTFSGLVFERRFSGRRDGWRVIDAVDGTGGTALDWVDDSWLYAGSTLRVPAVDLSSLVESDPGKACLELRVLTNSHEYKITVPITFVARGSGDVASGFAPEWL